MALDYQNPFYLKQAQQKQHSLYNGKVLLVKHDPPAVYDSEETLQLAQETDESLAKHKSLEYEIERLLRAVVSQDIMSIVQSNFVVDTSNLQTELDRTKEKLETCIIKKEKEYTIKWLQALLGDLKGKSKNTPCVSDTIGPLSQKLEDENVSLEFQVRDKKYAELTKQEKRQDDCDVQELNIVLQGTELSYQERKCKLYNEFDKFTSIKGESLHEYYLHFAQIINDMHTIGMTMQQVQVNTKFLNALQPEWSKFVTDVKLAKNIYPSSLALVANHQTQLNSVLFLPGDDLIACLNKAMAFMSTVVVSRFPSTNNQLRTSSNLRNQATIPDGKEDKGEGHMTRQCTKPKRPRNSELFKEKTLLVQTYKSSQVLDEEQLAFLVDPRIPNSQAV
ncbi:hypothetical protein Tco_1182668 [Tanacetum coccineum]